MTLDRDSENYYDLLGLKPDAGEEEIESAYADLSSMFAADKVPTSRQDYARKQRARLAAAYAVLLDPDQRAAYDGRLRLGLARAPQPAIADLPPALRATEAEIRQAPGAGADVDAAAPPAPVLPVVSLVADPPPGEGLAATAPPGEGLAAAPPPVDAPTGGGPDTVAGPAVLEPAEDRAPAPVEDGLAADKPAAALAAGEDEDAEDAEDFAADEDADADEDAEDFAADEDADGEDYEPEERARLPIVPASAPPAPVSTAIRVAPARPAAPPPATPGTGTRGGAPARPGAPPLRPLATPAARAGVALPSRREAAQIAARQAARPPTAAAPSRQAAMAARPGVRPSGRPLDYDADDELPRGRAIPPAAAPPRRRRRKSANNRFAYQVMTLVIGLVLVLGTVGSFLSTTINSGTTGGTVPTAAAPDAPTLVNQANSLLLQHNLSLAQPLFEQALQVDPKNLDAMLGLIQVGQSKSPPDQTLVQTYATRIIQTAPNSSQAQQALQILTALSKPTAAPGATPPASRPPASSPTPPAASTARP
ncbi:MAG TPA: DnaJ domain-containing protein [Chloroflexia bacterium]|nr:DnaJ domain-containing protein [Chloroflexia bacterium]